MTSSISGTSYVYGSGGAGSCRGRYVDGSSYVQGIGGTGAGSAGYAERVDVGGGGWITLFYRGSPPTNYGAGCSADCAEDASGADVVGSPRREGGRGVQGVVIVRYQYQNP